MADTKTTQPTAEEQAAREEQAKREQAAREEQAKREQASKQEEKLGGAPHLVRNPDEINPGDVGALAIDQAEQARLAREQRERDELAKTLPQSTLDEMEAGKAALGRKQVAAPQAVENKA